MESKSGRRGEYREQHISLHGCESYLKEAVLAGFWLFQRTISTSLLKASQSPLQLSGFLVSKPSLHVCVSSSHNEPLGKLVVPNTTQSTGEHTPCHPSGGNLRVLSAALCGLLAPCG